MLFVRKEMRKAEAAAEFSRYQQAFHDNNRGSRQASHDNGQPGPLGQQDDGQQAFHDKVN